MSLAGFYSANEHRAYPLIDGPLGIPLPEEVLVDFGVVMGIRAEFDDQLHRVWLHRVARSGTTYTFEFRANAPGCRGRALVFTRDLADPEYATSFERDDEASGSYSSSHGDDCVDDPIMEGFLVTGLLEKLPDLLANGEEWADHGAVSEVEPATVQNLARTFVRAVNLANKRRTLVDDPAGCSSVPAGPEDGTIDVQARCLTGRLQLKEGYNCVIRANRVENSVTISGQVGAGEGEACDEVKAFPAEENQPGSNLLTGGPKCNEVLRTINGVGGRVINFKPGDGVRIDPDPDLPNTLVVEADLHGMALCVPPIESSIVPSPPASSSDWPYMSSSSSYPAGWCDVLGCEEGTPFAWRLTVPTENDPDMPHLDGVFVLNRSMPSTWVWGDGLNDGPQWTLTLNPGGNLGTAELIGSQNGENVTFTGPLVCCGPMTLNLAGSSTGNWSGQTVLLESIGNCGPCP
jgi:hypothetical protein